MSTTSLVILAAGTALIVGGTIYYCYRRRSTSTPTLDIIRHSLPPPPSPEQYSFVQQRVETYRDEMLRYELPLERNRRGASRAVLEKLLAGQEEVLTMPILYLNTDEWRWEQQQLQKAVEDALGELGLSVPPDVREPTTQAARACEQWAATEAKRLFDEELGSDSREG